MSLKRLIGAGSGVIFRGSGFYQTDYRSESYKKSENSEKPTAPISAETKNKGVKSEKKTSQSKSSKGESNP
jgi:hypothetical protein